jgi:hypothetical protein
LAAALTAKLETLARKPKHRHPADMQPMFQVITDLQGDTWMEMDSCEGMTLLPAADLGGLTEMVQPWIDDGLVPPDTLSKLLALLESRRGEFLFVHEAFPQVFKDLAKTRRQMIDEGLLEHPTQARGVKETETMVTLTLLTAP